MNKVVEWLFYSRRHLNVEQSKSRKLCHAGRMIEVTRQNDLPTLTVQRVAKSRNLPVSGQGLQSGKCRMVEDVCKHSTYLPSSGV